MTWSPGYGWEGVCLLVPCPEGSSRGRPAAAAGRPPPTAYPAAACSCKPGYYITSGGDLVWDEASSSWTGGGDGGGGGGGGCVAIPCPPYATRDKNGKRQCVCDAAYEQKLTFDSEENRWTGNCTVATSILPATAATNTSVLLRLDGIHGVEESTTTTFQIVLSCCSALLVAVYAIFRYTDGGRLAGLVPKELRERGIATAVVRTIKVCMARVTP
jgi:hypothetical protein